MTKTQVAEIKKDENGKIWVRFVGKKKFNLIPDNEISTYLVYLMVKGETGAQHAWNSLAK